MLESFELRETRGSRFALLPGQPVPELVAEQAPEPSTLQGSPQRAAAAAEAEAGSPPAPSGPAAETIPAAVAPQTARLTPDEMAALALAADAASLDPEQEMNANLRNRGVGLVPRVVGVDLAGRHATIAAGAVQGFFRVPLGWHVIDDGRRTLIFDAGGKMQINLSQRLHEGASPADFARACLDPHLEAQPDLPVAAMELDGFHAAGVRGAVIDGETLDQCFMVRDLGRPGLLLVARVTAAAEDSTRALDLAGDVVANFSGHPPAQP